MSARYLSARGLLILFSWFLLTVSNTVHVLAQTGLHGQGRLSDAKQLDPTALVIYYAGGPVIGGTANAYVIYYGNWGSVTRGLIDNWLSTIGGSSLFGINTTYLDSGGDIPQNALHYQSATNSYLDAGVEGTNLTDPIIQTIVSDAISGLFLPADNNGVYFVLRGTNISGPTGLCGNFIGYHSSFAFVSPINGQDYTLKYAVVANVSACKSFDGNILNGDTTTPNGDVAADGTINWMFHELSESISDPETTVWGAWGALPGSQFAEAGDICENNYGTWGSLPKASNGAHYNITISGVNYLIQQLFQVAGGIPTAGGSYSGTCEIGHQPVISLASNANPATVNQSITFTSNVVTLDGGTPTGTITFYKKGNVVLGTIALSGGQASLTTSFASTGTKSITATYSGDSNYLSSTSPTLSQTVDNTSTALSSSPNPCVSNQPITLTATVTPEFGGTPTGTVTFYKNGTIVLGTATLSGAQATISTSFAGSGNKSLTALYSGDSNYTSSVSPSVNVTVNPANTTTLLAAIPNPSSVGQPVTLTATVTPQFGGTATGTITFFQNGISLGTASLGSGPANFSVSFATSGTESVTATYSGDANYAPSTSPVLSQNVNPATTTTSLAGSPNPCSVGQSVTFSATVTPEFGGNVSGTITFYRSGTVVLGTATISAGQASLTTSLANAGTQAITATYSGDSNFGSSTSSTLTLTVNPAGTSTSLSASPNPSVVGQSVTFSAVVTSQFDSITGTVTFYQNGTIMLGTTTLNGNQASLSISFAAVGTQSITATYSGDVNHNSSTSSTVSQTISQATTTTSLTSSPNPSTPGQSVAITASVTSQYGGTPGGSVTFTQNGSTIGTVTLTNGQAIFTKVFNSPGSKALTAIYSGDSNFQSSTGTGTQMVN